MGASILTLDTILSATFHHTRKWSEHLVSNQARDLLRFVIMHLYSEGQGNLINATWTQAQSTIAKKLDLSARWVGELTARLQDQGWIDHASHKLPDGMNSSTVWRAGRQLKRLIISITKSHMKQVKRAAQAQLRVAKGPSHFFPPFQGVKNFLYPPPKKDPQPEDLKKLPGIGSILGQWLQRGKEEEREKPCQ